MKRGRPPGSRKLPDEFYLDLFNLFDLRTGKRSIILNGPTIRRRWKQGISKTCRAIIAQGGVRWIDRNTGRTVATITNEKTLRRRVYEAWDRLTNMKLDHVSTADHPLAHIEFSHSPTLIEALPS